MARTAKFIPNEKGIQEVLTGVDISLQLTVRKIVTDIGEITPRDLKRLPIPINRKDGLAPRRQGGVVNIGGNYYKQVTGRLKSSIDFEKVKNLSYKVGSAQSGKNPKTGEPTNAYGMYLEFGTKYMAPRSFIRKGILDNIKSTQAFFTNQLKKRFK